MASHTATISSESELVPENYFVPVDLGCVFARKAPLEVDLGCGEGSFLADIAAENPGRNFLGIERQAGRVRSACRKIERSGLTNARVLASEISYAVGRMLPANSITTFHLLFPDPWPKRRHAGRRLVTDSFLAAVHRALHPGGLFHLATDHLPYFEEISRRASVAPNFSAIAPVRASAALSKFEKIFKRHNVEIHRLSLRKISPVT
ncbi:MAG TPA: tRNA (guanosine(46)-N7)-methyltransferase TrmB [Chthoniobacterales bacterium]|nr:tRNA (guanosine(46)-N7)-methyltransferase TrmB [Chthoniobacterales bacterium]